MNMGRKLAKRILVCVLILVFMGVPVDANAQAYSTKNEVYRVVKDSLIARKSEFVIKMSKKTMREIGTNTDVIEAVFNLDDKTTVKDADYLKQSVSKWGEYWRSNSVSSTVTLSFKVEYETTLKQEQKLDTNINSVLKKLNLSGKTDYEKVKAMHDYIIKRVTYDENLTKHSAYNALIDKSAVCEGYSAAAYLMFNKAGIDCRIVNGSAGGGPHSWNIVKVDGKWYNIDLTWDDPITSTGEQIISYDYFLKNAKEFYDHYRDQEYRTTTFLKTYPIVAESYKK
jgi:transglutaminase/protease-like cytokinesis protein 3